MTYFSERYGGAFISLSEAIERTGRSRDFILASVKRGDVHAVEIGSALFVDSESLQALSPSALAVKRNELASKQLSEQENELERIVREGDRMRTTSGPARFVFERKDVVLAAPILAIALFAIFLSLPVISPPQTQTNVAQTMSALFPLYTAAESTEQVQADVPSSTPRDIAPNSMSTYIRKISESFSERTRPFAAVLQAGKRVLDAYRALAQQHADD